MAIEVYNGNSVVSEEEDLFARTSQCVAVGIVDSQRKLGGVAQIHFRRDHQAIIDGLIEKLMSKGSTPTNYQLGVAGGCDAFVPQYGFIPGRKNADRVIDYLTNNRFRIVIMDTHSDYVRNTIVSPTRHTIDIVRIG